MFSKKIWAVLATAIIVSIAWLVLVFSVIVAAQQSYNSTYNKGKEDAMLNVQDVVVEGTMVKSMPLYMQSDPQWGSIRYADGTIESHGCGLTALSMALSYLTKDRVLPSDLVEYQGNFVSDGVNDPDRMCQWAIDNYDVQWPGEQWGFNDSVPDLVNEGYVVLASMSGQLGKRNYDGHVILIYGRSKDGWLIRDPDDGDNSVHVFSGEELSGVTWGAFNGLKGIS